MSTSVSLVLRDTFIEPFYEGAQNIEASWHGKSVTAGGHDLSLVERITKLVMGVLLLIPLFNALIYFAFCEKANTPFVHPNAAPGEPEIVKDDAYYDALYQRMKIEGTIIGAAGEIQAQGATPEQANQRKQDAINQLAGYPAAGMDGIGCNPLIRNYDLDAILAPYNANHPVHSLTNLCGYAQFNADWELRNILNGYANVNPERFPQKAIVKRLFSQLYDFFDQQKRTFVAGSEQELIFKAQIRDTFNRIIDAHNNCIDQVTSQMESIVCDVMANFASIQGAANAEERLRNQAAYLLFKYKCNLIREICITEYPDDPHLADLERLIKQRIAGMMGAHGAIMDAGAFYNGMNGDIAQKAERVVNICLGVAIEDRATLQVQARRAALKYDPEKFLVDSIKSSIGNARTLRNDVLLWARKHFLLEEDNDLTTQFDQAISENYGDYTAASQGGNLTHQATLYLLEKVGIFGNGQE
jgi:hypothetical protein